MSNKEVDVHKNNNGNKPEESNKQENTNTNNVANNGTSNEVPDFVVRLVKERDELKDRHTKLQEALNSGKVPNSELAILQEQFAAMSNYLNVLERRVNKHTSK